MKTKLCGLRTTRILMVALASSSVVLLTRDFQGSPSGHVAGQGSSAARSTPRESIKLFAERCGGCHGPDAKGTDQGPPLVARRRLRARSVAQIRKIIHTGIPGAGMPAFDLPVEQLDA